MIRKSTVNDIDMIMDIWLSTNINAHSFISDEYWKNQFEEVRTAILEAEVYVFEDGVIKGFVGIINLINWSEILLMFNAQSFGTTDPQFGIDNGFYVFVLPGLKLINNFEGGYSL